MKNPSVVGAVYDRPFFADSTIKRAVISIATRCVAYDRPYSRNEKGTEAQAPAGRGITSPYVCRVWSVPVLPCLLFCGGCYFIVLPSCANSEMVPPTGCPNRTIWVV